MQLLVITRAGMWGSAIVLLVALGCARLGFWQLDRLHEKRDRNTATMLRMREAPAQLSSLMTDTSSLIFRRVAITGDYDDAHTVIVAGRSLRGAPGVHVLTPLLIGGTGILVNRGWMPSADAARIDLDSITEPSPRALPGLIAPLPDRYGRGALPDSFQRVWHRMDGQHLIRQFPYPVLPFVVQILPHPGAPPYPVRLQPSVLEEGPHLGYAIQWFGFAVISIGGWIAMLYRKRS